MKLPIVRYGDPILRAKGKRIVTVDAHVRELAVNMIETMHLANGIGLAAQQVGEALQLTVIDVSGAEDQESTMKLNGAEVDAKTSMPLQLLNPELTLFRWLCAHRRSKARRLKSKRAGHSHARSSTKLTTLTGFSLSTG